MKKKKPMPEYWYKGKPIKDEEALIKALSKDGKLNVIKNTTVYYLHEYVRDEHDSAFALTLEEALDMTISALNELEEPYVLESDGYGRIKSLDYVSGESISINGRKYTWEGGKHKLSSLGLIEIVPHATVYDTDGDDYCYLDSEEPLEFLREKKVFEYFEYHLEKLSDEEYRKAKEVYDI